MFPKMKRCIDKLRGHQSTSKVLQGGNQPGEDSVARSGTSGKECKCKCTGECGVLSESSMMARRGEGSKLGGIRKAPKVKQKIVCESSYWGSTKQIEEAQLVALVKRTTSADDGVVYKLVNQLSGAFNVAYILESNRGPKVCVRVPGCGFPARWDRKDAELLRATALGMEYIKRNSKLPIPDVLSYSDELDNEIDAPYIIISFIEGKSVLFLWNEESVEKPVLEARRQKILHSLANIMCTLSTTNFARAGTLWFPDEYGNPVVGDSYRLDKDKIFAVKRDFLTFPLRTSVADLLRGGREKRFDQEGFPREFHCATDTGVYFLWSLMIEAFLQSAAMMGPGEPEFVLMQSDFSPQNILADEAGNVTGIIDWDCLEAIPRQIGWCSLPHWLEADWYPDYYWPPETGAYKVTEPDQFDRYRQDYAEYMREACVADRTDSIFTSRSHIYQALFDSVESSEKVECFVYNVLADIFPRISRDISSVIADIGEGGFRIGQQEWLEARLIRYFAPDAEPVVKKQ